MSCSEPRLVLLGRQGAGKGTQSSRLADHFGVVHVSTGDMFRTQAAQGTAFGLEAKRYMDAGDLVLGASFKRKSRFLWVFRILAIVPTRSFSVITINFC